MDLRLEARSAGDNDIVHVLVQLCRRPTREEAARLSDNPPGINLLTIVQGTTYEAAIPRRLAESLVRSFDALPNDVRGIVRFIGTIPLESKQEGALLTGRFPPHGLNEDGSLRLLVVFYDNVTDAQVTAVMRAVSAARFEPHANHVWRVTLDRANLAALIASDPVKRVEFGPLRYIPLNDVTRDAIGVNTLQAGNPPSVPGLTGLGIRVAVVDQPIDIEHDDFWVHDTQGHRIQLRVAHHVPGASLHGTHVAGTIGGNGYQSNRPDDLGTANGGGALQWRGMAPEATLLSFPVQVGVADAAMLHDALVLSSADLSNHSYVHDCSAYTDSMTAVIDRVIRGDEVQNGAALPARAYIAAAGNNGQPSSNGCAPHGYFGLMNLSKNAIVVGNVFTDDSNADGVYEYFVSSQSSLGPTPDGRLKPDLVAPGCNEQSKEIRSTVTEDLTGGFPNAHPNGYDGDCGTSMAAAAVTGTAALLIEQWRTAFGCLNCAPLPSTLKAVLIQSAKDLVATVGRRPNQDTRIGSTYNYYNVVYGAGPDYVTGYGVIDAVGAREIVQAGPGLGRRVLESEILVEGEEDDYEIVVPPGTATLKVTLAWDDLPGNESGRQIDPKLINDLDLVLENPDGSEVNLPWKLPPLLPALDASGDHDPAALETIVPSTLQATRVADHLNNVEQVEVEGPLDAGAWTIRVTGYSIDTLAGAQKYSLASSLAISSYATFSIEPPPFDPDATRCLEMQWSPVIDGVRFKFPQYLCGFLPLPPICLYVLGCPGCDASGYCPGVTLAFTGLPDPLTLRLYDHATGRFTPLRPDGTGAQLLNWQPERGARHSIVVMPTQAVPRDATYTLGIRMN